MGTTRKMESGSHYPTVPFTSLNTDRLGNETLLQKSKVSTAVFASSIKIESANLL